MVSFCPMASLTSFTFPSVLVLLFSTCCLGLPSIYRRAYGYYPPMMAAYPAPLVNLNNPWEFAAAQEPLAYDQPEDPFENNLQWMDVRALSNLLDTYDNSQSWGRIVNEMPEDYPEETESEQPDEDDFYAEKQLAELKRASQQPQFKHPSEPVLFRPFEFRATTSTTMAPKTVANTAATKRPVKKLFLGQKEIPLLRPPNHHNSRVKPVTAAPVAMSTNRAPQTGSGSGIVAAQLTTGTERQKKPSPYDTLREYLSIEDQIKKEATKRRLEMHHEVKRNSRSTAGKIKNFVADEATLTGQLSSLRKSPA